MPFPLTTSGSVRVTKISSRGRANTIALLSAIAHDFEEIGARRLRLDGNTMSFSSPALARRPTWSKIGAISKGIVSIDCDRGDLIIRYKCSLSPASGVGFLLLIAAVVIWTRKPEAFVIEALELLIVAYLLVLATQALIASSGVRRVILRSAQKSGFVESERE